MRLASPAALVSAAVVAFVVAAGSGCEDPCVTLASRICNCEVDPSARINCRTDRIVNQQSQIKIDDADREFCRAKLESCSCDALDHDNLDACGFANVGFDAGPEPAGEGEGEGEGE